jgi:hypothetical protein
MYTKSGSSDTRNWLGSRARSWTPCKDGVWSGCLWDIVGCLGKWNATILVIPVNHSIITESSTCLGQAAARVMSTGSGEAIQNFGVR